MKSGKENLFLNAIMLTVATLIMRIISIVFKVYISNNIGAEGMGIYKLITTVYMIAVTFSISGISTAITRIVSEEIGRNNYSNVKYTVKKGVIITLVLSLLISVAMMFTSKYIGVKILKDIRTVKPLFIIAISIPFVAMSATIKGYFYGIRDVFIPVTSQIVEQLIKITVVVFIIKNTVGRDIGSGCIALVLGTLISEVVSCIYVYISYYLDRKEKKAMVWKNTYVNNKEIVSRFIKIAIPTAGSSYTGTCFKSIETMLIPIGLIAFGMSKSEAVSVLGGVMGMVFPIIMFPAVLLMSMGTIIMPEIARANAINNTRRVNSLINRSISFTATLGIISFLIFCVFGNELALAIYKSDEIGRYFYLFSYILPFMYMDMLLDGILKGLNQQVKTLQYQITESLIRVILIYTLLPLKGVNGLIITMYISVIISFTLSLSRVMRITKIKINVIMNIVVPAIIGVVTILIGYFIYNRLEEYEFSRSISITSVIIIILAIYFIIAIVGKVVKFKDDKN